MRAREGSPALRNLLPGDSDEHVSAVPRRRGLFRGVRLAEICLDALKSPPRSDTATHFEEGPPGLAAGRAFPKHRAAYVPHGTVPRK